MPSLGKSPNPSADPGTYPGDVVTTSCVITESWLYPMHPAKGQPVGQWSVTIDGGRLARQGDREAENLDRVMTRAGYPALADRTAVLAIGSNAAPGQLRHKFAQYDQFAIPATRVTVTGLAVGHSAHISNAGYIPYAAFTSALQDVRSLLLLWLDANQLSTVRTTEPNYVCTTLTSREHTVRLDTGDAAPDPLLFRSRWGVLRLPTSSGPAPATTQADIVTRLSRTPSFLAQVPEAVRGPDAALRALAQDQPRRERLRDLWAREGLAIPDGLHTG